LESFGEAGQKTSGNFGALLMPNPIIAVENLDKRYRVKRPGSRGGTGLRHALEAGAKNLWKRLGRLVRGQVPFEAIPPEEEFWALKDVSFEVMPGECVGIIGRNGAGKSTLLKILSRITEPSAGRAIMRGRVGSLLEVGTGFHAELTGRENIFLNGAILGMRRHEILRRMDDIVAFAEVDAFLDTPVKHYSSGMYMRLAFAVAAHLDPEILIVDEVLAVGDAQFQKKCLGRMSEVAKEGRTVLFVSHNMHAVKAICDRGVVLRKGMVDFDGPAAHAIDRYLAGQETIEVIELPDRKHGSGEWRYSAVETTKPAYEVGEPIVCQFQVVPVGQAAGAAYLSGLLLDAEGTTVSQFDSRLIGVCVQGNQPVGGELSIHGVWLKPGRYTLDLYIFTNGGIIDMIERATRFEVTPMLPYPHSATPDAIAMALVLTDYGWRLDGASC
jgi:lipopolysaccharide transport system ATP-binding protein